MTTRIKWTEEEASDLSQRVDECESDPIMWRGVAKDLNAEHGNNRSPESCRKKWDKEIRKQIERCNPKP